jgi:hypothetical protein
MTDRPECHEVQPILAEVAIDAATGHGRALALGHVADCPACRRELDELAEVVDGMLLLAPRREPPAGFESAVLARRPDLGPEQRPAKRWRFASRYRMRLVLIAGGAVALLLAFTLGAGVAHRQAAADRALAERYRQTLAVADGRYLRAARLTGASGGQVGTVFLYQGNPSWLLVTVAAAPADGAYRVTVEYADGQPYQAGVCELAGGSGTAAYRLSVPVSRIQAVRLDGPAGATLQART